jgi:NAD(P)-dependent dehydrogenase (short-subunit alcohol dehydrogenase family)
MTEELLKTSLNREAILLTDSIALVTGGGSGIGRGIAMGLAEFGAHVAILDTDGAAAHRVATLIEQKGRRALPITGDVRDREVARAAVRQVTESFGALNVLINNVGGTRPIALTDMTDAQIDRQIDLNLKSLVTMTQVGAKAMLAGAKGGAIINIASIEGSRAAPCYSVYAACKAAMMNFTRTTALELAEHDIRVNAIAPDLVPTEHMVRFAPSLLSEEGREAQARYIPLRRAGDLDDCAGVAVFLASRMASYVTGVTIGVDGGTWASSGWTRHGGGWRLFS